MNSLLRKTIEVLFPATCVVCQKDLLGFGHKPVCASCLNQIHPMSSSPSDIFPLDYLWVLSELQGNMRELVHAFKYRGKEYLASVLAEIWGQYWIPETHIDCLVPVPMSYWREIKRGYNQAHLLANEISKKYDIPVETKWLKRARFKSRQVGLTREERVKNAGLSYERVGFAMKGKTVLLIDDVYTTGATLKACAKALKEGGAKEVGAATLAYEPYNSSPRRRPGPSPQ